MGFTLRLREVKHWLWVTQLVKVEEGFKHGSIWLQHQTFTIVPCCLPASKCVFSLPRSCPASDGWGLGAPVPFLWPSCFTFWSLSPRGLAVSPVTPPAVNPALCKCLPYRSAVFWLQRWCPSAEMAWCPLTRWHAIFTPLRCQASQMFFSSTGKLSIAGVWREAFKCQLLGVLWDMAEQRLCLGGGRSQEVSSSWYLSGAPAARAALVAGYGHVLGL